MGKLLGGGFVMISLKDCIDMSGFDEVEVDVLVEYEYFSEIVVVVLGVYLLE